MRVCVCVCACDYESDDCVSLQRICVALLKQMFSRAVYWTLRRPFRPIRLVCHSAQYCVHSAQCVVSSTQHPEYMRNPQTVHCAQCSALNTRCTDTMRILECTLALHNTLNQLSPRSISALQRHLSWRSSLALQYIKVYLVYCWYSPVASHPHIHAMQIQPSCLSPSHCAHCRYSPSSAPSCALTTCCTSQAMQFPKFVFLFCLF